MKTFEPGRWRSGSVVLAAALLAACSSGGGSTPVNVAQSSLPRDTNPSVSTDDAAQLASDDRAFALSLYQTLRAGAGSDDNIVFSPTSISIALAMLYNGAAGDTAAGMATALHFNLPLDRLNAAFDAADLAITTPPPGADGGTFQLTLADSLWAQEDLTILPAYLDVLATDYGAGVHLVDFIGAPESARAAINGAISDQTQGLIPTLFPMGSIDTLTRLVLANAVYFHGDWVTPFDPNSPSGTFHAAAGDVTVPMMSGMDNGFVSSGTGWSAAVLPYDGNTTAMFVVVPDAGTFDSFEQGLTADSLAAILGAQQTFGAVTMPRFKFSKATALSGPLSSLGMSAAFSPAADFSGIDGATDLMVTDVFHQAVIAVDEKGTTAAAATGVGVGTSVSIQTRLVVDRPFLFFIVHEPTGALLFAGRVVDPSVSG
ncbi:MAG TPA: serpin family protein [Polyangia bacterium]|nr:serpin family protein [Polyangia bacterium]